jgi:hypothetical protein
MESKVVRVITEENRSEFDFACSVGVATSTLALIYDMSESDIADLTSIKNFKTWQEVRRDPWVSAGRRHKDGSVYEFSTSSGEENRPTVFFTFEKGESQNTITIIRHSTPFGVVSPDSLNVELLSALARVSSTGSRIYGQPANRPDTFGLVDQDIKIWLPDQSVKTSVSSFITGISPCLNVRYRTGEAKMPSYYVRYVINDDKSVSIFKMGSKPQTK